MTLEELDKLPNSASRFYGVEWVRNFCKAAGKGTINRVDARSVLATIDGLLSHISRLERDARAGRELRNKLGAFAGPPGINMLIEAYNTATESKP